jgi:hypothetical protein
LADKRKCELLPIEPLTKVTVEITPLGHKKVMKIGFWSIGYGHPSPSCKRVTVELHMIVLEAQAGRKCKNSWSF